LEVKGQKTVVPIAFKPFLKMLEQFGKVVHKKSVTPILLGGKDGANFVSIVLPGSTDSTLCLWLNKSVKGDDKFSPKGKNLKKMCSMWDAQPRPAVKVTVGKDQMDEAIEIIGQFAKWFKKYASAAPKKKAEKKEKPAPEKEEKKAKEKVKEPAEKSKKSKKSKKKKK